MAVVGLHAAIKRVGAFGLHNGYLRDAVGKAEVLHLKKSLTKRGAVGEIASGYDEMVGNMPVKFLGDFEGGRLLSFEAIRVDGVEQVDRCATDNFAKHADTAIEICMELAGERAIIDGLREFPPRDFAFGDKDEAVHAGAGSVCGHGCGRVAC